MSNADDNKSLIPASVDNAFKNLTDKPTQSIGQTISDCWFLVFGGISQKAEIRRLKYAASLEQFKNELDESIKQIPEENRIEPSSQVLLTALDNSKYCVEEDELRSMFVKLISSAADKTKHVHPAFASIIAQMSPNDAKVLKVFRKNIGHHICDFVATSPNPNDDYSHLVSNVFIAPSLSMPFDDLNSSIENLLSLGILVLEDDFVFDDIDQFKETPAYKELLEEFPNWPIKINTKIIHGSGFGHSLIKCCIPDDI